MYSPPDPATFNQTVWEIVRKIPGGQVATYGQIAAMIPPPPGVDELQYRRLRARWVGSAMHAVPSGSDVPWQRVINSKGEISVRARSEGHLEQRILLQTEGVVFDSKNKIDLATYGWQGPAADWLDEHGLRPSAPPSKSDKRKKAPPDEHQSRLF